MSLRKHRAWLRRERGLRSKLEARVIDELEAAKVKYEYEAEVWEYEIPARVAKYTIDLKINKMYYEIKGYFSADDRKKMKLVREQHGQCFVMVFDNPQNKITKRSKTTYASWCDANDIPWISVNDFIRVHCGGI
jgi:hypothetical protein